MSAGSEETDRFAVAEGFAAQQAVRFANQAVSDSDFLERRWCPLAEVSQRLVAGWQIDCEIKMGRIDLVEDFVVEVATWPEDSCSEPELDMESEHRSAWLTHFVP